MKISGFFLVLLFGASAAFSVFASDNTPASILPREFSGWQSRSASRLSQDPSLADPANAALLKEYGFTDFESVHYVRDDGHKLTVKAARFADASGAYGAFTYYKLPPMLVEKIGDQGASWNERVLFYRGNILVDADFDGVTAMSAAELRSLADGLTLPNDNGGKLPGLPAYLPPQSYIKNSAKYVVGPVGLAKLNAPIGADLVGFDVGAEVVLGSYNTAEGDATLMLISYPTPQIAAERLRNIDGAQRANSPPASGSPPGAASAPIFDRRTGPIVAIAAGPWSPSEAKSILASVNYEANVTWNENTYFTKKDNIGNLIVNVLYLCGIIAGFAVVAGLAFGGFRLLIKRFLPDRIFDRREDVEFISLHLAENEAPSRPAEGKPF
jgi:hypothetical protein